MRANYSQTSTSIRDLQTLTSSQTPLKTPPSYHLASKRLSPKHYSQVTQPLKKHLRQLFDDHWKLVHRFTKSNQFLSWGKSGQ